MSATAGTALYKIGMKFKDADFESPVNFPFTIPASYERVK
jgi:hypothetical protein